MEGSEVSDKFAPAFSKPSLRRLTLNRTEISNEALRHIAHMADLEYLDLRNCNDITDAGLMHLERLTKLRSLRLGYTWCDSRGS